jgi:Fur family ferric uptake transcriptional regulator
MNPSIKATARIRKSRVVQDAISHLRSKLGRSRLKWSIQREHIVTTFLHQKHVTIRELYGLLNRNGHRTPLGSIYRTMRVLCEVGFAQARCFGEETQYDNMWVKGDHDHLICTQCGHIVEFEEPTMEDIRREIAAENGFSLTARTLELYGICLPCQHKGKPAQAM